MPQNHGETTPNYGEMIPNYGEMNHNLWGNDSKLWGNEAKYYGESPQRQSEYTPVTVTVTVTMTMTMMMLLLCLATLSIPLTLSDFFLATSSVTKIYKSVKLYHQKMMITIMMMLLGNCIHISHPILATWQVFPFHPHNIVYIISDHLP